MHSAGTLDDIRYEFVGLLVKHIVIFFRKQLCIRGHGTQGLLQIVTRRVRELPKIFVGPEQRSVAFG